MLFPSFTFTLPAYARTGGGVNLKAYTRVLGGEGSKNC